MSQNCGESEAMRGSDLGQMATLLRVLCADMVEHAGSGHPGMPMGMADVATTLFAKHFLFDPDHPEWVGRDRFILSSGHGSALAYALLHLVGQPAMTLDELKRLRRKGSLTPGHPEFGHTPGIECTTGPLGQGFATAVGMAISEKKLRAELGDAAAGHRIFVMAGDGCLMEGINHEAAALAGHLRLDNLVVFFDDNAISIDGPVSIASSEDVLARFAAYGWDGTAIDGHDVEAIDRAIEQAKKNARPTLIACRTQIGRGAPTKAGSAGIHGSPLGRDELAAMREALGWRLPPFAFPPAIVAQWRGVGHRGRAERQAWLGRIAEQPQSTRDRIDQIERRTPPRPAAMFRTIREQALHAAVPKATRVSSKDVLERLVPACPWLLGGSADLSGSNGTRVDAHRDFSADDPSGNYLRYGIREHAMAAAMNGIALAGAYTPYGGTFLVFSDYCRPAIRLAALMRLRVIYVFTHDSIGLGEDGPTHQPIEHLASLRLIPGLRLFRPADAIETAECWELALDHEGPSVLALSRQDLPPLRRDLDMNRSARGGYVVIAAPGKPDVTFLATGSEVHLAVEARSILARHGIEAQVVSIPCLELLDQHDPHGIDALIGPDAGLRVAIEAGSVQPWRHLVGEHGILCGIDCFGESASARELFEGFGLTAPSIAQRILAHPCFQELTP